MIFFNNHPSVIAGVIVVLHHASAPSIIKQSVPVPVDYCPYPNHPPPFPPRRGLRRHVTYRERPRSTPQRWDRAVNRRTYCSSPLVGFSSWRYLRLFSTQSARIIVHTKPPFRCINHLQKALETLEHPASRMLCRAAAAPLIW